MMCQHCATRRSRSNKRDHDSRRIPGFENSRDRSSHSWRRDVVDAAPASAMSPVFYGNVRRLLTAVVPSRLVSICGTVLSDGDIETEWSPDRWWDVSENFWIFGWILGGSIDALLVIPWSTRWSATRWLRLTRNFIERCNDGVRTRRYYALFRVNYVNSHDIASITSNVRCTITTEGAVTRCIRVDRTCGSYIPHYTVLHGAFIYLASIFLAHLRVTRNDAYRYRLIGNVPEKYSYRGRDSPIYLGLVLACP